MNSPTRTASPTLLAMAAPLVVSFWMRAAVTIVDTVYGALIGDSAVAAIGLSVPFEFLMIAIWVGISTGLTSGLSRAMGANEGTKVAQYLRVSWRLVWIASPAFTLLGVGLWFWAPHMGLAPEVESLFRIYAPVLLIGSAATTFWSIIPDSLVKAHQDTRTTMWAGIYTNVVNVALNTLFLFVFDWGIFGIALSTSLGRIAGLVYAIVKARQHEARRLADPGVCDPDPAPYRRILGLAVPASVTFALMATEAGIVNWILARGQNPVAAIAAYSIFYRVMLFALQPVIATSVAMLPFAARRFGASDWLGARKGLRDATVMAALYALALWPVLWLTGGWIARSLAESPVTLEYVRFSLWIVPLSCLVGAPFMLARPVFEAMGRGRPGLVMAMLRYLVLMGPFALAGKWAAESAGYPSYYGILLGLTVSAALASAIFLLWLWRAMPDEGAPAFAR